MKDYGLSLEKMCPIFIILFNKWCECVVESNPRYLPATQLAQSTDCHGLIIVVEEHAKLVIQVLCQLALSHDMSASSTHHQFFPTL